MSFADDWATVESNPEKFGYELVARADKPLHYEFDTVLLLRRKEDNALVWAADSGCSCPEPFGRRDWTEDFPLLPQTYRELEARLANDDYETRNGGGFPSEEREHLLRLAREG